MRHFLKITSCTPNLKASIFRLYVNRLLIPQEAAACARKEEVPMKNDHYLNTMNMLNILLSCIIFFKLNEEKCKNLQV